MEEGLDRVCEICGESVAVESETNLGVVSLRCRRHSVGISQQAEEIYWQRRSASSPHESEVLPKQQTEEET